MLTATGLIIGESLWGVVFAGIVAGSGRGWVRTMIVFVDEPSRSKLVAP